MSDIKSCYELSISENDEDGPPVSENYGPNHVNEDEQNNDADAIADNNAVSSRCHT